MNAGRYHREAGKMRLGCLVSVLVLVAGTYLGIGFLQTRIRYFQIQDLVEEQANFASTLDDGTIRARLVAKSDQLGLPLGPRRWTIRRTRDPRNNRRMITISAEYSDSVVVQLPGFRRVWRMQFTPGVTDMVY